MKKIIKLLTVIVLIITITTSISYLVFPNRTKSITRKIVKTTKQKVLSLRSDYQKKQYSSYTESSNEIWGIDISHHQREIDWNALKKNKPHFVYLKSTEGKTHIDKKQKIYKKKLSKLSIPTGAYHFFSYSSNGKDQAINFLKQTEINKGDLIPVLDVEYKKNMPNRNYIIKNIKAFIAHIKQETGLIPIIYCECDYYKRYLKGNLKDEHIYWISDFWRVPRCDYMIWQKTDKFKHNAFKGTVDFNVFNGDKNDFRKLIVK